MQVVSNVFLEILVQLQALTGNLGFSIILFTLIVRSLLLPLSLPSAKSFKKIRQLKPEIDKLKHKHKDDKKAFQMAQLELYKKYNVNPLSGCLPQVVQIVLFLILYQVLTSFLQQTDVRGMIINPQFFWLNLSQPDQSYVLPILSGVTQLILSIMILPAAEVKDIVPNDSKNKKVKEENKKEEDMAEMAETMQKQTLFILPFIIGYSATHFPSGLALYWVMTTLFSIVQQYFLSGPGGLTLYLSRVKRLMNGQK